MCGVRVIVCLASLTPLPPSLLLQNLWRSYAIEFPKYCTQDNSDECTIRCNTDNELTFVGALWGQMAGMMRLNTTEMEKFNNETIMEIAHASFCGRAPYGGDHLESSSPTEASFWPIHPTMDRLYQYKQLVAPFQEDVWDFDDEVPGQMYCIYSMQGGCMGHHAGDLCFTESISRVNGTYEKSYYTNYEMRTAMTPATYSLPYIYK